MHHIRSGIATRTIGAGATASQASRSAGYTHINRSIIASRTSTHTSLCRTIKILIDNSRQTGETDSCTRTRTTRRYARNTGTGRRISIFPCSACTHTNIALEKLIIGNGTAIARRTVCDWRPACLTVTITANGESCFGVGVGGISHIDVSRIRLFGIYQEVGRHVHIL